MDANGLVVLAAEAGAGHSLVPALMLGIGAFLGLVALLLITLQFDRRR